MGQRMLYSIWLPSNIQTVKFISIFVFQSHKYLPKRCLCFPPSCVFVCRFVDFIAHYLHEGQRVYFIQHFQTRPAGRWVLCNQLRLSVSQSQNFLFFPTLHFSDFSIKFYLSEVRFSKKKSRPKKGQSWYKMRFLVTLLRLLHQSLFSLQFSEDKPWLICVLVICGTLIRQFAAHSQCNDQGRYCGKTTQENKIQWFSL